MTAFNKVCKRKKIAVKDNQETAAEVEEQENEKNKKNNEAIKQSKKTKQLRIGPEEQRKNKKRNIDTRAATREKKKDNDKRQEEEKDKGQEKEEGLSQKKKSGEAVKECKKRKKPTTGSEEQSGNKKFKIVTRAVTRVATREKNKEKEIKHKSQEDDEKRSKRLNEKENVKDKKGKDKMTRKQQENQKAVEGEAKKVNKKETLQYRSNLVAVLRLIKSNKFTEEHKQEIAKSPFGHLLLTIIEKQPEEILVRKNDHDALKLIQTYDRETKGFLLGNKSVRPTPNDLTLVFGICSGCTRINLVKDHEKPKTDFVKRVFSREKQIIIKNLDTHIKEALKGEDETDRKDVARLLTLFLLATLFFPATTQTLSWCYVPFVEDLENIQSYAWATLINDFLLQELYNKCNKPRSVGGCIIGLLYWFCEHVSQLPPGAPLGYFPRFRKWTLTDLTGTSFDSLEPEKVKDLELEWTDEEKEKLFFLDVTKDSREIELENHISQLRQENQTLKLENEDFQKKIMAKNEEIAVKDEQLAAKDEQLAVKDEQIAAKNDRIKTLQNTLSEIQKPARKTKGIVDQLKLSSLLKRDDKDFLKLIYQSVEQPENAVVWKSENICSNVTLRDIFKLLNERELSKSVIDGYTFMLQKDQEQNGRQNGNSAYFTSFSWAIISCYNEFSMYKKKLIDEKLALVYEKMCQSNDYYHYLVFPMNSTSQDDKSTFHWSLLVFDIQQQKWLHYNPEQPAEGLKDPFLEHALTVKSYVEKFIKNIHDKEQQHPSCNKTPAQTVFQEVKFQASLDSVETPQQSKTFENCGAIVCHIMGELAEKRPISSELNAKDIRLFRVKICCGFLYDSGRSWTREGWEKSRQHMTLNKLLSGH